MLSVICCLAFGLLVAAACLGEETGKRELYRIRIVNAVGGPVEVSTDSGDSYTRVGTVTRAATQSSVGYLASVYAVPGTVAATAVHGIRIKVAGERNCSRSQSKIISILPREFAVTPRGFGGYDSGPSGICTDIPTGEGIFRNLSPFVGNSVYRESVSGLVRIGSGYVPDARDALVIIVELPERYPREIIFQNRKSGNVTAVYPDGKKEIIARVEHPVRGVGRFDATGYTGVGSINTSHTGVLTVSTAPNVTGPKDGSRTETRGGFMVQPSRHARSVSHAPQILVVGPASGKHPPLEGSAPLFSGYIGLSRDKGNADESFHVDIKTEKSGWMELPCLVGKDDDALMKLPGGKGSVAEIRLRLPKFGRQWVASQITRSRDGYLQTRLAQASKDGSVLSDGILTMGLSNAEAVQVKFAKLYVDGILKGMSNNPPYSFDVDVMKLSEGDHTAELCGLDQQGKTVKSVIRNFFVTRRITAAQVDR